MALYGQRQPGLPKCCGSRSRGCAEACAASGAADIADEYSTGRGHLTTRGKIFNFIFVKLENVGAAMRLLADAGLTPARLAEHSAQRYSLPGSGNLPGSVT